MLLGVASVAGASEVETALQRKLAAEAVRGKTAAERIVEIGVTLDERVDENLGGRDYAAVRDRAFSAASLEARGKILARLKAEMSAGKSAALHADDRGGEKCVESAIELFASRRLGGWRAIAAEESFRDGKYSLAVAVAWSPDYEREIAELRERGGATVSAAAIKKFLDATPISGLRAIMHFTDADGVVHPVAIGLAEAGDSKLRDEVAVKTAQARAKANLLNYLFGDQLLFEAARSRRDTRAQKKSAGDYDDASGGEEFFSGLIDLHYRGAEPEGMVDAALFRRRSEASGGEYFVSAFVYAPQSESRLRDRRERVEKVQPSRGVRGGGAAVKVYNPATDRYETRW